MPLADLFPKMAEQKKRSVLTSRTNATQFTEHKRKIILAYILEGMSPRSAAILAEVSPRTFYYWMEDGQKELEDFEDGHVDILGEKGQFLMNVGRAQIKWAYNERKDIRKALMKDPKYSSVYIKLLEAEFPEYLGKTKTVEVKGEVEIRYNVAVLEGDAWTQRQITQAEENETSTTSFGDEETIEAEYADYPTERE